MAMCASREVWKWQKADTKGSQLKSAFGEKTPMFAGSATMPTEGSLKETRRIWKRISSTAAGQKNRQTTSFPYLGGAVTETSNVSD